MNLLLFYRDEKGTFLDSEEGDANMRTLKTAIESHDDDIIALQGSTSSSYTWAAKPLSTSVTVGTIINITDVGGDAGSLWRATYAGWVPLGGVLTLASNWGTLAAPIATKDGANGLFSPSGGMGSLIIPAGMLLAGRSKLEIEALSRRRGTGATHTLTVYLGTAGTTSDSNIWNTTVTATNNRDTRPFITIGFTEGVATTGGFVAPAGSSDGSIVDRTTNINLAAAMTLSIGVSGVNAADDIDLIGYSLTLRSI